MKYTILIFLFALANSNMIFAQDIKGYFGIVHPIVQIDKNATKYNCKNSYTVGFPFGINIPINKSFGYSVEIAPFITADSITTKVNSVLFHPGIYYNLPKKFRVYTRIAFETSGRFGYTFIFSKSFFSINKSTIYSSIPIAFRHGNQKPFSTSAGILIGITF